MVGKPPGKYTPFPKTYIVSGKCWRGHDRAAWPGTKPDKDRFSTYLQTGPPNPNTLEVFHTNNAVFNGLTMVDSMWAVSDRAGYPKALETAPAKAP